MYKRIEFFELANRNKNYDENSNGEGHLCLLYLVFISAFFLFLRKHPLQTATATPATVGKKKKLSKQPWDEKNVLFTMHTMAIWVVNFPISY